MAKELKLGITASGIRHKAVNPDESIETKFRMVKESGVYDYIDKSPPPDELAEYRRCMEAFDVPIRAGGWFYTLGRNEDLLAENLRIGASLGSLVHNTQIQTNHQDGHPLTDDEVADCYLRAYEVGESVGCVPTFEVHVNMWSEDFRRVELVADKVEARGVPFRMTLDHSHVMFKIDNPVEQEIQNIRPAVESGELILDPFVAGNVCDKWIERGFVWHAHARAAAPGGPKNYQYTGGDGKFGRGIQYPFTQPGPGEWHGDWDAANLEPWKEVVRHLLKHHATHDDSPL
ncbi:MAG: hypothetical protein O3A51_08940, partial [Verrucomicrobia bacterium]|nr:hypothetical protein [Verrucomicrobiota bacterium]